MRRRQEDRSLTSVCAVTEVAQARLHHKIFKSKAEKSFQALKVKLSKIMGGKARI